MICILEVPQGPNQEYIPIILSAIQTHGKTPSHPWRPYQFNVRQEIQKDSSYEQKLPGYKVFTGMPHFVWFIVSSGCDFLHQNYLNVCHIYLYWAYANLPSRFEHSVSEHFLYNILQIIFRTLGKTKK